MTSIAPPVTLSIPVLADGVDMLTAALAYAAAGCTWCPSSAAPRTPAAFVGKRWQTQSSRDPKQIAAWFAGTDHEIVLHCGRSGAVVYDVDKPANGDRRLAPHLKTAPFQPTRPSDPDRGHYVFAMPPGRTIGNPAFPWGEIRGLNGVIKADPKLARRRRPIRTVGAHMAQLRYCPTSSPRHFADASPAEDAASDAEVDAFLDAHTEAVAPRDPGRLGEGAGQALRRR